MRRLNEDESGATVVFFGVLMIFILLLVATVADTGRLYDERRQIQNGADAAALAVAFDCARDESTCHASAADVASRYASANAVDSITALDPTSPLATNPYIGACPGPGPIGCVWVDTRAQEPGQDPSDGAMTFVLPRADGSTSAPVRARAVAAWGVIGVADTVPLVISFCDFQGAAGDRPELPSEEVLITFHEGTSTDPPCDGHPGFDRYDDSDPLPAGFGALETDGPCTVRTVTSLDGSQDPEVWAFQDPGADFDQARHCLEVGKRYPIPIFTDFCRRPEGNCPSGVDPAQAAYRIGGFAMFEVTGFRFPGSATSPAPCSGSTSCLSGIFVPDAIPNGEFGEGLDFGARTAKLIG